MPIHGKVTLELNFDSAPFGGAEQLADALGEFLARAHGHGLPVEVRSPSSVPARDPPAEDDPLLQSTEGTAGATGDTEKATPPKRVRDRTAERKAAKEKADAEARAGDATPTNGATPPAQAQPPADDDDPLLGADESQRGDPFDLASTDPVPAAPTRTPQQLMDSSIIILRQIYGKPGGADQVKVIQKEFKVSQFTQVPLDKAGVLYNRALALANTLGVVLPPGA